jgi:hypothetical protein
MGLVGTGRRDGARYADAPRVEPHLPRVLRGVPRAAPRVFKARRAVACGELPPGSEEIGLGVGAFLLCFALCDLSLTCGFRSSYYRFVTFFYSRTTGLRTL